MSLASRMWSRLGSLVMLGRVQSTTAPAAKIARARAVIGGEPDDVPFLQPYGFQARPTGGQAVVLAAGGTGDEAIVVLIGDRRYLAELVAGEARMHDDQGHYAWLKRAGFEVEAPSIKLGATATKGVVLDGDAVDRSTAMGLWMASVTASVNALIPGAVTDTTAGIIGAAASSASKAVAE